MKDRSVTGSFEPSRKTAGEDAQDVETIWGQPLDRIGQVLLFVVEARGETELVDDEIEFLVVANGTNDLVGNKVISNEPLAMNDGNK